MTNFKLCDIFLCSQKFSKWDFNAFKWLEGLVETNFEKELYMEGDEQVLHRGAIAECLHHYGEVLESHIPRGTRGIAKLREPLAKFCNVSDATVNSWLRKPERGPHGVVYFKLICFLNLVGYEVTDLIRVKNTLTREITEIIGYGVLSADKVTKKVEYRKTSTLFALLRGENQPSSDREKLMREFCRENREKLRAKKEAAAKRYKKAIELANKAPGMVIPKTSNRSTAVQDLLCGKAHPIVMIMSGVSSFLAQEENHLTEQVLASLSEEDTSTILDLSSQMSALTSRVINARKK